MTRAFARLEPERSGERVVGDDVKMRSSFLGDAP